MPIMNSWEECALQYHFDADGFASSESAAIHSVTVAPKDSIHDAIIYPGIYAPSGYDIMNILLRVMARANPVLDLGAVDASCAIVLCDLQKPDCPVVYANEPFSILTGYGIDETLGRNCRFLQAPGGKVKKGSRRKHIDKDVVKQMRRAVDSNSEMSLELYNFKKNGEHFINVLTMIPICWDSAEPRFSVGFLAERTW